MIVCSYFGLAGNAGIATKHRLQRVEKWVSQGDLNLLNVFFVFKIFSNSLNELMHHQHFIWLCDDDDD